ncbi:MAG: 50S ribosomal protein L18 [Enterobacteriaceae bacterium PSpyr]|nr:MAG: 50S ribosomal protein L18 [Enterobacteriaceae bacterium PSpyr]
MFKKKQRLKRIKFLRIKIKKIKVIRLVIYRTLLNIYAQIIFNNNTLFSISTLNKKFINIYNYSGNKYAASIIGNIIGKFCINKGIKKVIFDRSGYKYHGRIKALAESARETGLIF